MKDLYICPYCGEGHGLGAIYDFIERLRNNKNEKWWDFYDHVFIEWLLEEEYQKQMEKI